VRVCLGLGTCWRECAWGWGLAGKSAPWIVDSRKGVPLIAQMGYQRGVTRVRLGLPLGRTLIAQMGYQRGVARVRLGLGTCWRECAWGWGLAGESAPGVGDLLARVPPGSWTPARVYPNRANGIPEGRGESAPGVRDLLARVRLGLGTCWRECAWGWGLCWRECAWGWGLAGESAPAVGDWLVRVCLWLGTCWRECACGWGLAGESVPCVVDSR
jgi:hypothetical protein